MRTLAERAQVDLPNVAAHEFDVSAIQVSRIGAATEQEPIQRGDARTAFCKRMAKIGTEEPGAPCDQYPATGPVHGDS